MSDKITTCLWFDNEGEEAASFYCSLLPNSRIRDVQTYGGAGPRPAGTVMTVDFELDGRPYLALNGGPDFPFTEAVSFQISCADQDEVDHFWSALSADGGEEGPCGWVKDRFGLSWQIVPSVLPEMLSDPDPGRASRAMTAMRRAWGTHRPPSPGRPGHTLSRRLPRTPVAPSPSPFPPRQPSPPSPSSPRPRRPVAAPRASPPRGACGASSTTWKLKAKPDDGKVEVGFEVDSNKVGQTWAVRITDNGTQVFAGNRKTLAPSGSFTVNLRTGNRAGTDTIRGRATNAATGQVCAGKVVL